MDQYGLRKACMWIGNSPTIAMKHYSLMRNTDYIDAGASRKSDAKSNAAGARIGENGDPTAQKNPGKTRVMEESVTPMGIEPMLPP